MVTVHIHRDFKMSHNYLIFLILGDHAKVRRALRLIVQVELLASFISRFTLLQFTNLKKHEKAMPFGV